MAGRLFPFVPVLSLCISLYGCTSSQPLRSDDGAFDRSLNRVIRKMGFMLLTMAKSESESNIYQEWYNDIIVDLRMMQARARVSRNNRRLANDILRIEQNFKTLKGTYDMCLARADLALAPPEVDALEQDCRALKDSMETKFIQDILQPYEKILNDR